MLCQRQLQPRVLGHHPGRQLALDAPGGLLHQLLRECLRRGCWGQAPADGDSRTHTHLTPQTGDEWDTAICPDPDTCAKNCALDGADYRGTYGINVAGDSASFKLVTVGQYDTNIGARTYVMDSPTTYKQYKLKNREFAFDVDVSAMPCGINGALYFVDMDADGGKSKYPNNAAGAEFGTGYCDAQCPHDDKFINGAANILGWAPDPNGDPNSGDGRYGTCCTEMDIWEANRISTAVTPHMCTVNGQYRCNGTECGDDSAGQRFLGVCDKDGCDMNPFRLGNAGFYGPGAQPPPPPPPSPCALAPGTNNMGTILGAPSIQADAVGCCAQCNATAGCVGFTFVEASSNCFLKSALGVPIADPGATSGTLTPPPAAAAAAAFTVDTTKPFTVVTQFVTADGTDSGALVEIRRSFIQDGAHIPSPPARNIPAAGSNASSVTDAFCKLKASAYQDNDNFETFGGLARMGEVMDGGMVLVLSSWVDYEARMLWLDSSYPSALSPLLRLRCLGVSGHPSPSNAPHPPSSTHTLRPRSLCSQRAARAAGRGARHLRHHLWRACRRHQGLARRHGGLLQDLRGAHWLLRGGAGAGAGVEAGRAALAKQEKKEPPPPHPHRGTAVKKRFCKARPAPTLLSTFAPRPCRSSAAAAAPLPAPPPARCQ